MYLEIITPDKKVFEGEITSVILPGTEGSFGVLNNHAAIISTLGYGEVKITDKNQKTQVFTIGGGVVEVVSNKINVLAENV